MKLATPRLLASPRLLRLLGLALVVGASAVGCSQPPAKSRKVAEDGADTQAAESAARPGPKAASREALGPIPDGPVARVGDKEVSRDAFMAIYDLKLQKYKDRDRAIPRSADRRYREHITERLVYQEVLRQECEKLGVDYDPADLTRRLDGQKKGLQDWEKHLRKRGESEESLKAQLVAELRERAILAQTGKLEVSGEDIQREYDRVAKNYDRPSERVRAAHILFSPFGKGPRPGPANTPEAEAARKEGEAKAMKRAEELYAKATAPGADFAALAREFSDGPSGPKGGDLGIFSKERMVPEFSEAAFALKPGEVSKPVVTKFGVHLIKLEDRYGPGPLPLEALKDQLRDRLYNQRVHKGRRDLKQSLMGSYTVDNLMAKTLPPPARPPRQDFQRRKPTVGGPPAKPSARPGSPDAAAQPLKPAPTPDAKPAATPDAKPAATADGKPAAKPDAKPATPAATTRAPAPANGAR